LSATESGAGRLRAWIAVLTLTAGLAGGLAGVLLERHRQGAAAAPGPFEAYQRRFLASFELSPERERLLSQILRHYQRDLDAIEQGALEDSMGKLGPELEKLGFRYRDLIRNHVLPEADRGEYDRLAQAAPWPAPSTPQ
jgi:hypothetical protein